MTYVLNPNLQASQLFPDKKDHTSILQINLMPLAGEDNLVHDLNGNSLKKKNTRKSLLLAIMSRAVQTWQDKSNLVVKRKHFKRLVRRLRLFVDAMSLSLAKVILQIQSVASY